MAIRKFIRKPEAYWGKVNPIGIRSCYDEGKRCAETLFFDYRRQHRVDIKVVRIFNTYGPRMHPNDGRVVSNFIVQALKGEDITIYGDGSADPEFLLCGRSDRGDVAHDGYRPGFTGPVNIGNPGEFSMLELAEKVITLTASRSRLVFSLCLRMIPSSVSPTLHWRGEKLGWEPRVSLEDGLKETIAYFRRFPASNIFCLSNDPRARGVFVCKLRWHAGNDE